MKQQVQRDEFPQGLTLPTPEFIKVTTSVCKHLQQVKSSALEPQCHNGLRGARVMGTGNSKVPDQEI